MLSWQREMERVVIGFPSVGVFFFFFYLVCVLSGRRKGFFVIKVVPRLVERRYTRRSRDGLLRKTLL